ncbi:MAG: hypothetical protein K6T66_05615 [Peptococcaceae bacterium]|nr:hypothetical protein [Peptococcaceae bacterium]
MNKRLMLVLIGVLILVVGATSIGFAKSKYSAGEYKVQKQVIQTFSLTDNDIKPLFMRDVYDDSIAKESTDLRGKIAIAIDMLLESKELKEGDFKPVIFLKGSNKLLIGIKHPDNTVSLTEFDISKDKPIKVDKRVKEVK